MGVFHDFRLSSVHAHVLLIGWATMVISGVVYIVLPTCGNNWLAKVHYWLLNVGLPGMILGLVLLTFGKETGEKIVAPSSVAVLLAVVAFAVNVFLNSGSGVPRASNSKLLPEARPSEALPLGVTSN